MTPQNRLGLEHPASSHTEQAALLRSNAYPPSKRQGDLGRFCPISTAGHNRRLSPLLGTKWDTWLIRKPCHTGLTTGRVPRDQREAEFRAYQSKRRRFDRDTRLL
jgi:hypothetical protein